MVKVTPAWISGNFENAAEQTELSLKKKEISQIDDISHLVNLRKLDLSENALKHADSLNGLGHLKFLSGLNLSHNSLSELTHVVNIERLSVLNISHNSFNAFPNSIERLTNLKALVANNNQVKSIRNIKLPSSLTALILSNNSLEELSEADVKHLVNLKKLSLSHNLLHSLPSNLPDGLKELRANDNKLCSIENLPNSLEIIDIGNNLLTDASCIHSLRLLKNLNMAGNKNILKGSICNPRLEILDGKPVPGHQRKPKQWHAKPWKTNKN